MVERRCDQLEYEGSRMYDENPDRYMLEREAKRLLEECRRYDEGWLESLINILFHDEIYRRRCRYRRCSRWW